MTARATVRPLEAARTGLGRRLAAQYLEVDRRLLGAFRIYFGLVLLADLFARFPVLTLFYTNDGTLPNHYAIFAPMAQPLFSLFFAFSTKGEVTVAFAVTALVYAGLVVGYRTRWMQIGTAILYPSLISRNLFFEMGGSCCLALAASFTLFLPLGDRFSVDAVRASLARRWESKASALNDRRALRPDRTPHASLIVIGLLLQVTAIYFFNCVQKFGRDWMTGDAVHWVLWQNRIATALCGVLRMHEPRWFSPAMSWGTLAVEGAAPFMLLAPFVWRWTRSIYVVLVVSLHLGIALLTDVGPYSYVMFAFDLLMLPGFWFDRGSRWLRRGKRPRTVVYDPTDAGLHAIARLLARMDDFELLRFSDREAPGGADVTGIPGSSVAVLEPDGTWRAGPSAVVAALSVTPFGFVWTVPPLVWVVRVVVASRALLARVFGWAPGVRETHDLPACEEVPRLARASAAAIGLREAAALLFLVVTMGQIARDNWWLEGKIPDSLRRGAPGFLAEVPLYLRQLQGWMMFRVPPRDDATVIVDAETVDGRHIDPFTGEPPDFDVALHGPLRYGQFFCDYFVKIGAADNAHYRTHLASYLTRWQELEGRPIRDRVRAFRVLLVESRSPPPGQTTPTDVRSTLILAGP